MPASSSTRRPGEVDAIEGYCLAIRREALRAVGGFDRRFRFYRNADLDFSFAVRDAGWRAIRTEPLPVRRHEHRGWTSLPEAERDRLSKRNFYRFLDRWGDRPDLLLHRDRNDDAASRATWPWLRRRRPARRSGTGWRSRSVARSSPGGR